MPWLIILILVGIPLLTLAWWGWADARLRRLPRSSWRTGCRWATLAFSTLVLGGYVWFVGGRLLQLPPDPLRGVPGSWWMAMVMIWGLVMLPGVGLPVMLGAGTWRLGRKIQSLSGWGSSAPRSHSDGKSDEARRLTRREVLGAAMAMSPMVLALGATAVAIPQKRRFRVRELQVDLPDLPEELDGLRIAHVSDSHVGRFTHGPVLDQIARQINRLEADLVLFTGDLIDYTLADLPEAMAMLGQLQRDRLCLVEGNHDLFDGREGFERGLAEADFRLLGDRVATAYVRGWPVQLLGVSWHGRSDARLAEHVGRVAAMRDPEAFAILLAHHPHAFDAAVDHRLPLTLAGHTHGGQLMLTREVGAGPAMFRYWSGLYSQGRSRLVVSNGVGNWFPLRTAAPAEIGHLTLRRAG